MHNFDSTCLIAHFGREWIVLCVHSHFGDITFQYEVFEDCDFSVTHEQNESVSKCSQIDYDGSTCIVKQKHLRQAAVWRYRQLCSPKSILTLGGWTLLFFTVCRERSSSLNWTSNSCIFGLYGNSVSVTTVTAVTGVSALTGEGLARRPATHRHKGDGGLLGFGVTAYMSTGVKQLDY